MAEYNIKDIKNAKGWALVNNSREGICWVRIDPSDPNKPIKDDWTSQLSFSEIESVGYNPIKWAHLSHEVRNTILELFVNQRTEIREKFITSEALKQIAKECRIVSPKSVEIKDKNER